MVYEFKDIIIERHCFSGGNNYRDPRPTVYNLKVSFTFQGDNMSDSNKKDLDDKILTLVWEDRKKDALIIQDLKSKYETIEGRNFEEITVDDLVSSISHNWYRYVDGYKNLYNQDNWHNFVQTKTHEEAIYETKKLSRIIEGARTNICFNRKYVSLRTITVGKLIELLLAKPELIP